MDTKRLLPSAATLLLSCILLTGLDIAQAATRSVVFRLKLADNRTNCATPAETGARRPCDDGHDIDAVGHLYEVWDKDDDDDDEYIGTWLIAGSGTRRITFEWENASYSKGEANPDVYLKYINQVRATDLQGARVTAVDTDGSSHPVTSWRSNVVAENCTAGADCELGPGIYMIPTIDPTTERGGRVLALDSAQHTLEAIGAALDQDIEMHYPGSDPNTSFADSQTVFHVRESGADEGMVPAHELGHLVQMQQFGQDDLRNDCSLGGNGHWLNIAEYESCATTEGWADYVAAVSWYEPNDTAAVPWAWGFDFEESDPEDTTCADNGALELQVAKAFWDEDDWNDESGTGAAVGKDDNDRQDTVWIARGWAEFADGTNDREDYESGVNGVNVKDYFFNNEARMSGSFGETLRGHNCLQFQETN